jgi:CheY-like chemotaxis protein
MMGSDGIIVNSETGKGSAFTFAIRLEKAANVQDESAFEIPDLTGKHILIVEDIEINREVLIELLDETHAEIDEAVDGVEAVSKFTNSPLGYYHFVFMDLLMPNMNGFDAARTIRALPRGDAKTVPVVALSANAFPEDVDKSLEAGMNGHLAKPINFVEMMRVLGDMVG